MGQNIIVLGCLLCLIALLVDLPAPVRSQEAYGEDDSQLSDSTRGLYEAVGLGEPPLLTCTKYLASEYKVLPDSCCHTGLCVSRSRAIAYLRFLVGSGKKLMRALSFVSKIFRQLSMKEEMEFGFIKN